jgi:plastocyanin
VTSSESLRARGTLVVILGLLLFGAGPGTAACSKPKPTTHTVLMESTRFQPDTLTVKAGDSIVWVNKDFFPHTATSPAAGFDSGRLEVGQSWTYQATKKGEFAYTCTFHPPMKATLRVE